MKRNGARKLKSHMISFRVNEDYLARLDALVQQTSYSRAEVLRRCLVGAPLKSTVDAQALTEVARVHADLNRIGGLLKLAIREGVSDRSTSHRLNLELACKLVDAVQVQDTRTGSKPTYHLVISLHPEDRRLERAELEQVVHRLVDTLGFSEHQ